MQLSWSRVRLRARIAGAFVLGGVSILYAAIQPGLKTRPPHTGATPSGFHQADAGPASSDLGRGSSDVGRGLRLSDPGRQPAGRPPDERWWKREPIRFLQTNLSENDSTVDPKALVAAVADFGANTFLMNMGGIVAQYPTRVPFHYPSTFLPPGRDLFGDVVRAAHARKVRVVGRFDLSKTQKPVFDAHPEWFFVRAERRAGDLQRPLLDLHQRQLLPRARADDPRGSARPLRGRRAVLQHVRQPRDRLQRRGDGPLSLPGMSDPLSRPVQPPCAGRRRCGLSILHGRLVARGRRDDCRADPPQAARCRVPHLHQGPHRRHHVRVEHRGRPGAAAVAVFGERQRQPIARVGAGQGRDQPGDELHRLSVALCERAAGRDGAALVSEHRARRAARHRRIGTDGAAGSQRPARRKTDLRLARAARGPLLRAEQRRTGAAARHWRHGVVPRLLPSPDRGAHPVRRVREPALDGGACPLRSRDRAGSPACGARTLRPRRRPAARGRNGAAADADRRHRRQTDHAGILAHPRSRGAAVAEEHRADFPRRGVSRDGAAAAPAS